MKGSIWTSPEDDRLRELAGGRVCIGMDVWQAIADQMPGRSLHGCRERWRALAGDRRVRPSRAIAGRIHHTPEDIETASRSVAPSLRYATPFAEFLGEPPIGRSALDRRRGVVDALMTGGDHGR